MKIFEYLKIYLKHQKAIDEYYNFSLKGKYGEQVAENLNWKERTKLWLGGE